VLEALAQAATPAHPPLRQRACGVRCGAHSAPEAGADSHPASGERQYQYLSHQSASCRARRPAGVVRAARSMRFRHTCIYMCNINYNSYTPVIGASSFMFAEHPHNKNELPAHAQRSSVSRLRPGSGGGEALVRSSSCSFHVSTSKRPSVHIPVRGEMAMASVVLAHHGGPCLSRLASDSDSAARALVCFRIALLPVVVWPGASAMHVGRQAGFCKLTSAGLP